VEQSVARLPYFFGLLLVLAGPVCTAMAGPGTQGRKTDGARVPALIETLKSAKEEKARKAAADELGRADARISPELVTALISALLKDPSSSVRVEAAESIGQLGSVFPLAGVALEAAASGDPSPLVRLAAKKALWEYHLNGYRSPRGADTLTSQTVEPPIASPAAPRTVSAIVPARPDPIVPLVPRLPHTPTLITMLPQISPPSGPRHGRPWFLTEMLFAQRPAPAIAPAILNIDAEPPIAKRAAVSIPSVPLPQPLPLVPPPTVASPAELPPPVPAPDYIPKLPPFMPDLPSVVLPPDATPIPSTRVPPTPQIPATLPPPRL
jgi:hypothetical protein